MKGRVPGVPGERKTPRRCSIYLLLFPFTYHRARISFAPLNLRLSFLIPRARSADANCGSRSSKIVHPLATEGFIHEPSPFLSVRRRGRTFLISGCEQTRAAFPETR